MRTCAPRPPRAPASHPSSPTVSPSLSPQDHLTTHGAARAHTCPTCGKVLQTASSLRVHARVHTGERPFVCDPCGKGFTTGWILRVHKASHAHGRAVKAAAGAPAARGEAGGGAAPGDKSPAKPVGGCHVSRRGGTLTVSFNAPNAVRRPIRSPRVLTHAEARPVCHSRMIAHWLPLTHYCRSHFS